MVNIHKIALLIPSLAGIGSFFGGILLLLGGLLLPGFAIALLGIMLMLFYARLMANQQQQQHTAQQAQLGQELAQQHGIPQQMTSYPPYPPYPPTVIVMPNQEPRPVHQQYTGPVQRGYTIPQEYQGRTKVCPLCDNTIPKACQICPICGALLDQEQPTQWRGF